MNFDPEMALAEDANQEMSSQFELAENLRKLEKAGGYDLPKHQSKASWLEWLQGVIVWIIIIIYIIYIYYRVILGLPDFGE